MNLASDFQVCTVDSYQGDEDDIDFIHFVHFWGKALPYVASFERIKAAITRSRGQVILVGNYNELLGARSNRLSEMRELAKLATLVSNRGSVLDWDPEKRHTRFPGGGTYQR